MNKKWMAFALAFALACNAVGAFAQVMKERKPVLTSPVEEDIVLARQGPGEGPPPGEGVAIAGDNFVFVSTEMSFNDRVVKGAPYSAQAVTESIQTLADGNRIVHKNTAQVYRDSEGRTRRDQALGQIGPYAAAGDPPQTVFINDPVAGVNYILDARSKTARKLQRMEFHFKTGTPGAEDKMRIEKRMSEDAPPPREQKGETRGFVFSTQAPPPGGPGGEMPGDVQFFKHSSKAETKTEKLEATMIEGVRAEGSRTTVTIPAGELGNEQPIEIVNERWYSPDLQAVVMTRHSDPRFGETTYKLTNIQRSEPAASLFQVPADYAVKEGPMFGPGVRRMKRPGPPPKEN